MYLGVDINVPVDDTLFEYWGYMRKSYAKMLQVTLIRIARRGDVNRLYGMWAGRANGLTVDGLTVYGQMGWMYGAYCMSNI